MGDCTSGVFGLVREPSPVRSVLYEGGESSRVYEGEYLVRSRFVWPDGSPGEHETEAADYLACHRWVLLAAEGVPLGVTDPATGRQHQVRVTSTIIEAARG